MRFIKVQAYSMCWIWQILSAQACAMPPRSEIYLSTNLFHILDVTNLEWTDLFHTNQIWDLFMYRPIPCTEYDKKFWVHRPVPYHPIWDLIKYRPIPYVLDMTNFECTVDLFHASQIWDLIKYRPIPCTGYDEFWVHRHVPCHPYLIFIEVQAGKLLGT